MSSEFSLMKSLCIHKANVLSAPREITSSHEVLQHQGKTKTSNFSEPEVLAPAEDDTLWPDEPQAQPLGRDEVNKNTHLCLTARDTLLLNMDSKWLADVLSEDPSVSRVKTVEKKTREGGRTVLTASGGSDNDFKRPF